MTRRQVFRWKRVGHSVHHSVHHSVIHSVIHSVVIALLLIAPSASAQPAFEATIGRALDSMAATATGDDRGITAGGLLLEHWMASERLRIFYDLDAGDYTTPGDWRYFLHQGGATWRADLGQGGPRLFVGGTGTWRDNGASWAAAGYQAFGAFANLEARPRDGVTLRTGYRLDVRRFPDYAELDQTEHGGFGSVLVNLPSKTTLIGELRVGGKAYQGLAVTPVDADVSAATGPTMVGQGRGRGAIGLGAFDRVPVAWAQAPPTERAGQVSWMGRVAQSLADRTGVSAQYYQRETFGSLPPIMVLTPALFFDDGVYDDPFASEQRTASTAFTQVFARGDSIEAWGSWSRKAYTATPAYGLDGEPLEGEPLRNDRIWRGGAAWTHALLPHRTGPLAVDVVLRYDFTRHQSNDLFYNYRSHVLGFAVSVGY